MFIFSDVVHRYWKKIDSKEMNKRFDWTQIMSNSYHTHTHTNTQKNNAHIRIFNRVESLNGLTSKEKCYVKNHIDIYKRPRKVPRSSHISPDKRLLLGSLNRLWGRFLLRSPSDNWIPFSSFLRCTYHNLLATMVRKINLWCQW